MAGMRCSSAEGVNDMDVIILLIFTVAFNGWLLWLSQCEGPNSSREAGKSAD